MNWKLTLVYCTGVVTPILGVIIGDFLDRLLRKMDRWLDQKLPR